MMTQKRKEYMKEYRLKNKEKIAKNKKEHYLKNEESIKKYRQEYSLKNKENIAKKKKAYSLNNKENIAKYKKKYYLNNKEYLLKIRSAWDIKRRKNNPNYKLRNNLRSRIWSVLKGIHKSTSTMKLLGCSIDELWNHLESKFKPWMTKENYGLWHVDHIKPCASFDLTCPVQQLACFHYTNLQPLSATDNRRKGAR